MSSLTRSLACLLLLLSICQANTGAGSPRASTTTGTQGRGLKTNAVVGLGAVTGFLLIVFIILIVKRVFFQKDGKDEEEHDLEVCATYDNKALEVETAEDTKISTM